MNSRTTLLSLFNKDRETLERQLTGLMLPKDTEKIQEIISSYFHALFESEGEYRQQLTQAEEYILISALGLIRTQHNMIMEICKNHSGNNTVKPDDESSTNNNKTFLTLAGTAAGGIIGTIAGTWGILFAAMAGTAVALYYNKAKDDRHAKQEGHDTACCPIDAKALSGHIGCICESTDSLMETFRTQAKRIINSYEQREEPTLLNTYSMLAEQISYVIGMAKGCKAESLPRLQAAVSLMEETLENYNMKYENGRIINI